MPAIHDFIQAYSNSLAWGESLAAVPDQQWLAPMKPGAWSIAECLAHLIAWDRYLVDERLPFIHAGAEFTESPDTETVNASAAAHARSGITQAALIGEFMATRSELIDSARRFASAGEDPTFLIPGNNIVLSNYLNGMLEHHLHHQKQTDGCLVGGNDESTE